MMRQDQNRIASPTIRYTGATHAYHIRALMDDSNPEMIEPSHLAQWLQRVPKNALQTLIVDCFVILRRGSAAMVCAICTVRLKPWSWCRTLY